MKDALIVTRHAGLIEVLRADFGITGKVISHATPEAIRGKRVVGVLPLHLAAEAASVTEVVLDLPADKRGVELSADEVRQFCRGLRTFVVRTEEAFRVALSAAEYEGACGPGQDRPSDPLVRLLEEEAMAEEHEEPTWLEEVE
jgi:putative CRISPR-associated protein (TIGR02620 family)